MWSIAGIAVALSLLSSAAQAAVPPSWKESGFSINAQRMTLRGVLDEFGRTYGVRPIVSIDTERPVKARLKADSGNDFLNHLAQLYRFRWFVYNDALYIVPQDDNTSLRLEVGEDAVQDAKAALVGLGLYEERFGWGELPDEGVVIVSGPRAYVNLARDILLPAGKKTAFKGKQIMLFRLKYASATDRVINARGQSETVPGIKTILSNLLFGSQASEKTPAAQNRFDVDSNKRSRQPKNEKGIASEVGKAGESFMPLFSQPSGSGKNKLLAQDSDGGETGMANGDDDSGRQGSKSGSSEDARPRIEADPSRNAILIYDYGSKRDMYAALIADLDLQPQQVEIEALIVDIDRSKLSELGVEWGVRAGAVTTTVNSTTGDSQGTDLPIPGATLLISNLNRFYTRLKAMESTGEAHVLATPTVLTLDNVAAVLDLSQSAYVSLVGERVADLADVTAGTMLRVIPRIIQDGAVTRVRLEVDIEDGSLDKSDAKTGTAASAPSVTRSTISTQAIMDMQQTLMIGGYRTESLSRDKQKVPFLGDLPLIGGLFRSESQSHSTRERLFLITPRVSGTTGVAAAAVSKNRNSANREAREQEKLVTAAVAGDLAKMAPPPAATVATVMTTAAVAAPPAAGVTPLPSADPAPAPPRIRTKCARPRPGIAWLPDWRGMALARMREEGERDTVF